MSARTQTVPNHVDQHRDVRWGWDAKGTVIALAALILTTLGMALAGLAHIDARFEAQAKTSSDTNLHLAVVEGDVKSIHSEITLRVAQRDAEYKGTSERLDRLEKRSEVLIDGQMHNRYLLEKWPPLKREKR